MGNSKQNKKSISRKVDHASHDCKGKSDFFCYVCGKFEVPSNRRSINEEVKKIYHKCFDLDIKHQDTKWIPHIVCNPCRKMFDRFDSQNSNKKVKFARPMIWREPKNSNECYICMTNTFGINQKKKSKICYANVTTVDLPVLMSANDTNENLKEPDRNIEPASRSIDIDEASDQESLSVSNSDNDSSEDSEYNSHRSKTKKKGEYTQTELNDLVRSLGLAKDAAEVLASSLREKNLLSKGTKVSYYRDREKDFRKYFEKDETSSLVYCSDVFGLMDELKKNCYEKEQWRLFIDSSLRSLKAVLLHNGNVFASIPIAYARSMKEEYNNIEMLLTKIQYEKHNWQICGDLKMTTILLGQQSGYTKYPCFICLWDSRDSKNHYKQKVWAKRKEITPGSKNVIREPLVDRNKILLPPLHIKLGLMKQFVKALDEEGECFQYLGRMFPQLSYAKLKAGIFDGPQIRTVLRDPDFTNSMTSVQKAAWVSFKKVTENFLGNHKSPIYKEIVHEMVANYRKMGCHMSLKLHFLDSHIDRFPDNLGDYSEEQGERFHQDIKVMEERYQGRWDVNMMADYCWTLKEEQGMKAGKRKKLPLRRSFERKRVRYNRQK